MSMEQELRDRFRVYQLDEDGSDDCAEVRSLCLELSLRLNGLVPDGREKSLAVTHLEDVMHWANKGIARSVGV